MPLNTVQTYLKGILDQTPLPLGEGTLSAQITPPSPGEGMVPTVYIWGSVAQEARQTMPRAQPGLFSTGGFAKIIHKIDLWVVWYGFADDADADSSFPAMIDAVTAVLRNTLMPVQGVVDPVTGGKSTLLAIGEKMDWDYAPVHSTADQRMLRYVAKVTCTVEELLQA